MIAVMLAVIDRQNSQDSSVASERISTAIASEKDDLKLAPVDLEDADTLERRLRGAIERMKVRTAEMMRQASPGRPPPYTRPQPLWRLSTLTSLCLLLEGWKARGGKSNLVGLASSRIVSPGLLQKTFHGSSC